MASGPTGVHSHQRRQHATHKCNRLNEVVQCKTACSWSLLLLHNTVGGVLWAGETRAGCLVSFYIVIFNSIFKKLYIYDIRQEECNKRAAAALISTAYRAPRLSLCVCRTFTLSLKVRRLVKCHNPWIAVLFP